MKFPKAIFIGAAAVFALVAITAFLKKGGGAGVPSAPSPKAYLAVRPLPKLPAAVPAPLVVKAAAEEPSKLNPTANTDFPLIDRMFQLFTTGPTKLPIVETVTYTSSVAWLQGRPAWIADYAAYYATSRHFIARSLNGKPDYWTQKVIPGSRFNVLSKEKNLCFYLLADLSRCKMGLYCIDLDAGERIHLKTYSVGVGRMDAQKKSASRTPQGRYSLGSKVAIYKPGMMGLFQEKPAEMVQVFGSRWIPFDQELEGSTEPAKGYGIHGAPWSRDAETGQFVENRMAVGTYQSDGCIRLLQEDMEELFAIIISRPAVIDIVADYKMAKLPGVEKVIP